MSRNEGMGKGIVNLPVAALPPKTLVTENLKAAYILLLNNTIFTPAGWLYKATFCGESQNCLWKVVCRHFCH